MKEYFLAERFVNLQNDVMLINSMALMTRTGSDQSLRGRVTRTTINKLDGSKETELTITRGKKLTQKFHWN